MTCQNLCKRLIFWLVLTIGTTLHAENATTSNGSSIVRLKPRGNAEQAYWLLATPDAQPTVAAILFTGGYGLLKLREDGGEVIADPQGGSFLTINRMRFVDQESIAAIVDVPSDEWNFGYTPRFRKSDAHVTDMRAVVADLRNRHPGIRIFLVGTSQGTTSAAYVGKALGKEIDGVVLTASVFEWAPANWGYLRDSNLNGFDFSQISAPLLFVHHVDDRCVATPYSSAEKLIGRYTFITVQGGEPVRDNGCGPRGPHGFLGREEAVAAEIMNWMHGRPYRKEIR